MKTIKLVRLSYKGLRSQIIGIMLILLLSFVTLAYLSGIVNFNRTTVDFLKRSHIEDAVYLKVTKFDEFDLLLHPEKMLQEVENIKSLEGVKTVLTQSYLGSKILNGIKYDVRSFTLEDIMYYRLPINGDWYEESQNYAEEISIVIAGGEADTKMIGHEYTLEDSGDGSLAQIRVSGVISMPPYTPSLNNSSTKILSQYLLTNDNVILVNSDSQTCKALHLSNNPPLYSNMWVVFEKGIKDYTRNEVLQALSNIGSFDDLQDILLTSQKEHSASIKGKIPIPLFLFFASLSSLLSITLLYVLNNFRNQVIFYLCGCSKKKLQRYISLGLIPIILLPALLAIVAVLNFENICQKFNLEISDLLLDHRTILLIIILSIVLLTVLSLIARIISWKQTPLEIYKRYQL